MGRNNIVRALTAISTFGASEASRAAGGPVIEQELGLVPGEVPKAPSIPGIEDIDPNSADAENAIKKRRRGAIGLIERRAGLTGGLLSRSSSSDNLIQ